MVSFSRIDHDHRQRFALIPSEYRLSRTVSRFETQCMRRARFTKRTAVDEVFLRTARRFRSRVNLEPYEIINRAFQLKQQPEKKKSGKGCEDGERLVLDCLDVLPLPRRPQIQKTRHQSDLFSLKLAIRCGYLWIIWRHFFLGGGGDDGEPDFILGSSLHRNKHTERRALFGLDVAFNLKA